MDNKKKDIFYITTPIFYPNANLHMGHAYTTCVADIITRFHRIIGDDTYLLTGADENTEKVVRAAKLAGKETEKYVDDIVVGFKALFNKLDISYDQFIRTGDKKVHWPGAIEIWNRLVQSGDIEKRFYKGLYCVGHEAFITEKDLIDGKCPDHAEVPQFVEEENYFFKLSKYSSIIKNKIESNELEIIPQVRKNEILSLLDKGLEDVSFSRPAEKMSVGIPVPNDPKHKIYVWGDALVSYISALGFGSDNLDLFEKFWPAQIHIIGKDILRFHAAIWPGMLLSAKLPLPKKILVHGFITSGGRKMSKSLGNVVDPNDLINEYGSEAVRYYLARHISTFEDGDLTLPQFKEAYNANLANGLGNLVNRILKMSQSYGFEYDKEFKSKGSVFKKEKDRFYNLYKDGLNNYNLKLAIDMIWECINWADKYIQQEEPFKLIKTDKVKAKEIIEILLSDLMQISEMLEPFMPQTSKTIKNLIKENKMPEKPIFPRKD